jgi:hypothetical protein
MSGPAARIRERLLWFLDQLQRALRQDEDQFKGSGGD